MPPKQSGKSKLKKSVLSIFPPSRFSFSSSSTSSRPRTLTITAQSQPPPPSTATRRQPPAFYLCPISGTLMADPVILSSGYSFEHNLVVACMDLNFTPPIPNLILPTIPPPPPRSSSSSNNNNNNDVPVFPIPTPNPALKGAIMDWCYLHKHPFPVPITPQAAHNLIKQLMPPLPPPLDQHDQHQHQHDQDQQVISPANQAFQQWILENTQRHKPAANEAALNAILQTPVCTPRILDAVVPFLIYLDDNHQALGTRAIYALSLNPSNHPMILGHKNALYFLAIVLTTATPQARASAAGALYRLATVESNRVKVGKFGVIRPLLTHFLDHSLGRNKALLALYYLSTQPENICIMVDIGVVEKLLEAVGKEEDDQDDNNEAAAGSSSTSKQKQKKKKKKKKTKKTTKLMRRYALVLINCMMVSERGREEFYETGGMGILLKKLTDDQSGEEVELHCLMVMTRLCKGSLNMFREAAIDAGLEDVLVAEVEEWGVHGKELARGLVGVIRGEITDGEELRECEVMIDTSWVEDADKDIDDDDDDDDDDGDQEDDDEDKEEEVGVTDDDPKGEKKLI